MNDIKLLEDQDFVKTWAMTKEINELKSGIDMLCDENDKLVEALEERDANMDELVARIGQN